MQNDAGPIARSQRTDPSHTLTLILIVIIALVAIAARLIPGPRIIDDAYITFRYSRNIIEGQGFVYNPGEYTLGTTTPFYTLLMAGIAFVLHGEDFPAYAIAVNALADAGTAVLLFLIVRRLTGNRLAGLLLGALLGVLWGIAPMSVTFAVGGMETGVSIFCTVAAFWLYLENRPILMGIAIGLGFLTRIDALLWIGPLLLYQLVEQWRENPSIPRPLFPTNTGGKGSEIPLSSPRPTGEGLGVRATKLLSRLPWRTWLAAALICLPWLVFSLFYFGSPIPHSLLAKSAAYVIPPLAQFGWLLPRYATPFFETGRLILLDSLIYLILNLLGIFYVARRLPRLLPYLIYPWLYLAVFSIANPPVFRWYTTPPLPALMLGIVAGAWAVIERLIPRRSLSSPAPLPSEWARGAGTDTPHPPTPSPTRRVGETVSIDDPGSPSPAFWERGLGGEVSLLSCALIAILAILWIGTSLNAWVAHPDHGPDQPAPEMAWFALELNYQKIGTELHDKYGVTPDTLVASADIGTIGYFSRARIIDTVGLVTPSLTAYYPASPAIIVAGENYAIPPKMILDTRPVYLVTMEAFVRLGLEQDPTFKAEYGDPIETIPTGYYGTDMRLYKRKN